MKKYAIGFDIGGTKCAVILGEVSADKNILILKKEKFATADAASPQDCLLSMCSIARKFIADIPFDEIAGVGISCGGPLDSKTGIIQSPPNLPGWDDIPAVEIVEKNLNLPAKLENDANACALAEWKFGAGRGTTDMIFLTFGTGLGAGIIAGGNLIGGASGMAGECGHIRLADEGPVGYGKAGSFEGFCSGGGIAQLGKSYAAKALADNAPTAWCQTTADLDKITTKLLGDAAKANDIDACKIFAQSGRKLGFGLSILIDILNPQKIVIGSVFARMENFIRPEMEKVIREEALCHSAKVCQVVPAELGEAIGDIASLAIICG